MSSSGSTRDQGQQLRPGLRPLEVGQGDRIEEPAGLLGSVPPNHPSAITNGQSRMSVQTVGYIDRKSHRTTWRSSRRMRTSDRPPK